MKLFKKRKGVVSLYIVYLAVAFIIILITAFAAPLGVRFNTEMYAASEDIFLRTNESISKINDETVKAQIYDVIDASLAASQNNIDVNAGLFQYGWILILGLTAIILFLFTRRTIEFTQQGGGFI